MLKLENVEKKFGDRRALKDVSFEVGTGRITGFVGANGAGKTTAMRIILGVLTADSGAVSLDGRRITPDDRRIFGYMPEERGLYPKMRVAEQVSYLGRLHGMTARDAAASTTRLLEKLQLAERSGDTVDSLSLGNQQRAQIAAALVHEPEVLILDEPFSGLDPLGVDTVLGVLKDAAAGGAPVLFSSHQLDVVERLCDDLVIIAGGEIRAGGSRAELAHRYGHDRYEIELDGDASWIGALDGISIVERTDSTGGGVGATGTVAVFDSQDADAAQRVLARAVTAGRVIRFGSQRPSLAQIFREVIQ